jgi:hypothetical protein
MRVKQGNSAWYAADTVLKKFQQLAREGIYIRRDGQVKGPFTAIKAVEILEEEPDLDRTQAKVGIHADWIPAIPLLQKLRSVKQGTDRPLPTDGAVRTTESTTGSTEAPPAPITKTPSRPPEKAGPAGGAGEPAIELVMVAEPVQSQPTRPAPVSVSVVHRPRAAAPIPSPHHRVTVNQQQTSQRDPIMVWAGVLGVLAVLLVVGLAISVIVHNWPDAVAVGDVGAATESRSGGGDLPPVNAAPPVVSQGMLFRPSFETTIGQADGGTLFAARVGRSNRMVLLGAAHLLGPATGLPRQLRGSEVLMNWTGLTVVDCVTGKVQKVSGDPLRLRTAEYPTTSAHGDALAFYPNHRIGLEPLAVAGAVPKPGDPVWLLAPARGTEALVHAGRWLGTEDDWHLYRLDNQGLDMVGTSGGALVNSDHQVIGIHVAAGQSDQGVISIASPILPLIPEIQ